MTEKIEIYPKDTPCFFAIPFVGAPTPGLNQALEDLDLRLTPYDNGSWFIGEYPGDVGGAFIGVNEYFVRCGPLWIIMDVDELTDEFRIG